VIGRSALALASVVTKASAAMSDAARLPNMAFWCAASPPKRRPFLGAAGVPGMASALLAAERQTPLVQLLEHLVERLLAEVGDGQQIVLALEDELAHRIDLRSLEAVAGPLGQVEIFDRQVEIGRAAAGGADIAELEALRRVAHLGHQSDERAERVARRRQRLARRDGPVGFDIDHQT